MDQASKRLGQFVTRLNSNDLPETVMVKAKLCLMDAVGCLLGAHQTTMGQTISHYAQSIRPMAPSKGVRRADLDPATSAACHALLINALDYDDIFWKGHPGATVNGAVLSVAPILKSSGQDMIQAIVAGYEVSGRVAMSFGHTSPRKRVHGHGTWQTFGAAAATAKLLGLDPTQTAHALVIAGINAPVPSVMKTVYGESPSMAKNNFASAAHAGVSAAFMAKAGMEGPLDLFEGDTGFWTMAGAEENNAKRLAGALGTHFEITDVGFKAFSCCRIIQACAQAVKEAFGGLEKKTSLSDIEMIIAAVPEIACAPPFSTPRPETMWAAQFSVPHAIIATLLNIPPGPQWFTPQTLIRAANHPLTDKILLRPRRASQYHGADISLMLGENLLGGASVLIATGEAAVPLSTEFLIEKFSRLATPVLSAERTQDAIRAIFGLEQAQSPDALVAAIGDALIW